MILTFMVLGLVVMDLSRTVVFMDRRPAFPPSYLFRHTWLCRLSSTDFLRAGGSRTVFPKNQDQETGLE